MKLDEGLDEIRAIRHQLSAECGHDPARYCEMLRKYQDEHPEMKGRFEELQKRRRAEAAESLRVAEEP